MLAKLVKQIVFSKILKYPKKKRVNKEILGYKKFYLYKVCSNRMFNTNLQYSSDSYISEFLRKI